MWGILDGMFIGSDHDRMLSPIEGVRKLCIDFSNNQKTQVCQVPYIRTV